jgi:hypothetical protein
MRKLFLCVCLSYLGLLVGCSGGTAAPSTGGGNSGGSAGPVVLKAIQISPANSSILPLASKQFTAMGSYSDGSTKDLTSQVSWNSMPNTVTTISDSAPTKGVVQGLTPGVSVITAALGSVANVTQLTVASVTVKSIAVSPATTNISLGGQQQFTATATYSDGSTQDVTIDATWSSDPSVAAVTTRTGLAIATAIGSANITATLGGISNPAGTTPNLVVNADNLSSVAVQPGTQSIAVGTKLQFSAIGLFTDGSTRDLTSLGTWTSSDMKVASIGRTGQAGPGKFNTKSTDNNTTTITTSIGVPLVLGGSCPGGSRPSTDGSSCVFTGTASLSVADPMARSLLSITVIPSPVSMAPGTQTAVTALGAFSDSTTQDLTDQVSWSVASTAPPKMPDTCNNKTAATTISRLGVATGTAAATCNVTATFTPANITSKPAVLTVTSASLASIAITPAVPVVAPGSTLQLVATGTFSDNSTQDITDILTWTSSDSTIASIGSKTGTATGQGAGSAFIAAAIPANSAIVSPSVSSVTSSLLVEPLKSLTISSALTSFAVNSSIKLIATGTFSDGTTQDMTASVIWSAAPATVATVGNSLGAAGIVTGIAHEAVNVSATFDGVVATLPETVVTLTSITLTDADSFNISSGTSDQLKATGILSDGTTQDLTSNVVWSSSKPAVAVVNGDGLATGTGKGSSTVTATFEESTPITATGTLTVN